MKQRTLFEDTTFEGLPKDLDINQWEGMIYKITNLKENKFYIGKKSFWSYITKKPLKGKSQKRHIKKESKWKLYWGSSKQLLLDIERLGKHNFKREILKLCDCKWEMSYYEAYLQFKEKVIFREDSYNGILNLRVPKAPKNLRY